MSEPTQNGPQWRKMTEEPNDGRFRLYGLFVHNQQGHQWFEAHYVAADEEGQLVLPSGDHFSEWAWDDFTLWCDVPPPPSPQETEG